MSQTLNTVPAASGTTATLREFGTYEEAQQLVDGCPTPASPSSRCGSWAPGSGLSSR